MDILGIGFSELIFVLIIALMVFGPRRLPEIAAKAGRIVGDLRSLSTGLLKEWERELKLEELKKARDDFEEIKQDLGQTSRQIGRARHDISREAQAVKTTTASNLNDIQASASTSTDTNTSAKDSTKNSEEVSSEAASTESSPEPTVDSTKSETSSAPKRQDTLTGETETPAESASSEGSNLKSTEPSSAAKSEAEQSAAEDEEKLPSDSVATSPPSQNGKRIISPSASKEGSSD